MYESLNPEWKALMAAHEAAAAQIANQLSQVLTAPRYPYVLQEELRAEVGNFPAIEETVEEFQCALIMLEEAGASMQRRAPLNAVAHRILPLCEQLFGELAEIRLNLANFSAGPFQSTLVELPIDFEQFRGEARQKMQQFESVEHLAQIAVRVRQVSVQAGNALAYVMKVYERDLMAFERSVDLSKQTPAPAWLCVIQEHSHARMNTAQQALMRIREPLQVVLYDLGAEQGCF